jgi:hypothetical protein
VAADQGERSRFPVVLRSAVWAQDHLSIFNLRSEHRSLISLMAR